ncbi:MAG: hypothetical protein SF066_10800 [Thermoanaerobaculia bacterium]|nr:hypothetical protein [Thermoanaerobaculia bacterium]
MAAHEVDNDKNQASGDLNLPPQGSHRLGRESPRAHDDFDRTRNHGRDPVPAFPDLGAASESETSFGNKAAVMQYGLSLVGVVLGYYFGRVPLERRVDAAETSAKDSNKAKDVSDKKVQEAKVTLAEALGMMAPAGGESTRVMSDAGGAHWAAYSKLDALQNRL